VEISRGLRRKASAHLAIHGVLQSGAGAALLVLGDLLLDLAVLGLAVLASSSTTDLCISS